MEKKGVGRPRDGNPEETRTEILRSAVDAFAAAGFVGATTRAVASRAGVNVATLHYHFGSKEGLYRAALANASRGTLPPVPQGTGAETIERLVDALFHFGAERPNLARLSLLDALAGPRASGGEAPDERVAWLAKALGERLPATNGKPAPAPEATARSIVALVDATFVTTNPPFASAPAGNAEGTCPPTSPTLPSEAARQAVVAAALRLTGLG
jgi:AcrR family transcriptional regulator